MSVARYYIPKDLKELYVKIVVNNNMTGNNISCSVMKVPSCTITACFNKMYAEVYTQTDILLIR